MKKIFTLIFIFTSAYSFSQTLNGPESVELDPSTGDYFVANTGNGTIVRLHPDGSLSNFASGLSVGPYGIELVGDTLYACDGGSIAAFNRLTGSLLFSVNLGGTFLNGITNDGQNLYITDFSAKKIYRYNIASAQFNVYVTGLTKSPNGIIYDAANNRLVFVNWGASAPVMAVNLNDSSVTTLTTTSLGNCDGIAMNCQGEFYIASWSPQRISKYDNAFATAAVNMNVSGLSGPADIYFDQTTDTLCIPNSGNDVVSKTRFYSCLSGIGEEQWNSVSMYPNPVSEVLNVIFDTDQPVQLILTDLGGRKVNTRYQQQANRITVNMQELPQGVYLIQLISSGKIFNAGIVKQ